MSEPILLVVLAAATARLTRLVTVDSLTSPLRVRWFKRFPPGPARGRSAHPLGVLVDCPWCVSVWAAALLVAVAAAVGSVPAPWLTWAAVAYVAGLVLARLDG